MKIGFSLREDSFGSWIITNSYQRLNSL